MIGLEHIWTEAAGGQKIDPNEIFLEDNPPSMQSEYTAIAVSESSFKQAPSLSVDENEINIDDL